MSKTVTLGYTEIKYPFAFLSNGEQSTSVWFEVKPDKIGVWDDINTNWPRWTFCVQSRKEAIKTIKQMIMEGWELVRTSETELESLVTKSEKDILIIER